MLVLPLLLSIPLTAQALTGHTIESGGRTRHYLLFAPRSTQPLPAILTLHGSGGSAANTALTAGFHRIAEQERFIAVYPDAVDRRWNDGRNLKQWLSHRENVDDVGFFRDLIAALVKRRGADPKRIFITGISNGGLMSHRLGCELSDKIAGIAPVVRTITVSLAQSCEPARPVPVLMFFGTADRLVPFEGGTQHIAGEDVPTLSARQTIDHWRRIAGSAAKSENRSGKVVFERHTGGKAAVEAYILEGEGHTWPVRSVDASRLIWRFFSASGK